MFDNLKNIFSENNETVRLKKISGFFKDLGVDGLSTGNTNHFFLKRDF